MGRSIPAHASDEVPERHLAAYRGLKMAICCALLMSYQSRAFSVHHIATAAAAAAAWHSPLRRATTTVPANLNNIASVFAPRVRARDVHIVSFKRLNDNYRLNVYKIKR